jgi:hypothetical protein
MPDARNEYDARNVVRRACGKKFRGEQLGEEEGRNVVSRDLALEIIYGKCEKPDGGRGVVDDDLAGVSNHLRRQRDNKYSTNVQWLRKCINLGGGLANGG